MAGILKRLFRKVGPFRRYRQRQILKFPAKHMLKIACVLEYRKKFSLTQLVETGTNRGTMVAACRPFFDRIFSIELSETMAKDAQIYFKRFPHVTIYQGDSAKVLPSVLSQLTRPTLFWLDAHYGGQGAVRGPLDTPIIEELTQIFDSPIKDHVLLIDDADCFIGQNDYPTIDELRKFVLSRRPDWVFEVTDNIMRCHPRPAGA